MNKFFKFFDEFLKKVHGSRAWDVAARAGFDGFLRRHGDSIFLEVKELITAQTNTDVEKIYQQVFARVRDANREAADTWIAYAVRGAIAFVQQEQNRSLVGKLFGWIRGAINFLTSPNVLKFTQSYLNIAVQVWQQLKAANTNAEYKDLWKLAVEQLTAQWGTTQKELVPFVLTAALEILKATGK